MHDAKMRWEINQARRRVRPGITRWSKKRVKAVVYDLPPLLVGVEARVAGASYEGAMKKGRRTFVASDVIA